MASGSRTGSRRKLIYLTSVSPYLDGPAGVHGVLAQSVTALAELAGLGGLAFQACSEADEVSPVDLDAGAVLALFTIGETPWSAAQRHALLSGLRSGRTQVVSIHAATDSCHGWDEYGLIVGARFNGHPWTQQVDLEVTQPAHPATRHLGSSWPWHDEIYQFRDLRPDAEVLLKVPESQLDITVDGAAPPPFGFPMSWCFKEGHGRVFATTLGHFPAAWENPAYLRHLAGGLAWTQAGEQRS